MIENLVLIDVLLKIFYKEIINNRFLLCSENPQYFLIQWGRIKNILVHH